VRRRTERALTALADGTLARRRSELLLRKVARRADLARALEAQRLAIALVRARQDAAPPGLRAWIEHMAAGTVDAAMPAPSGEQIEIELGDQRATVVEVGGGLRSYEAAGHAVLDGYARDELCPSGRGQVLIPWPNRLEDGSYEFDGQSHQLAINEVDKRDAIHGLVRWANWTVREREANRVVTGQRLHPQPGYPFELDITVEYLLSGDGLSVTTTATNTGDRRCPYGSGAHPYLSLGRPVDGLTLHAPARTRLIENERGIPVGREAVDGTEYDFRVPRPTGATRLDDCFTDLERGDDGRARVTLDGRLTLWVDEAYDFLMLFTGDPLPDVNRRAIAVEPMTCPPNAFRSGDHLVVLEPGASHTGTWGISSLSSMP
jgi:aldose 1-epimerase